MRLQVLSLILVFILFISPASAIGHNNIGLGTKVDTCGDWHIKFQHIFDESSMTMQVFNISVQNLQDIKRDANITQILEPLTYDIDTANLTLSEWKGILTEFPTYTYQNVTVEQNCSDDNITYYDCSYNYTEEVQNGTEELMVLQWKPAKAQALKEMTTHELKENMQLINIPALGSKYKEADGTVNGTKFFQVKIFAPITLTENGWGSSGLYSIELDGCIFYDAENSSWWNETFGLKQPMDINVTENMTDFQILLNVTYDSDMQSDFSDLRFSDDTNTVEWDYYIESKVDGSYANIWIEAHELNITNGTQGYMYYDNSTGVINQSNATLTFDLYDDFLGSNVSTAIWNIIQSSGVSITGGVVTLAKAANPASMIISKEFNVTDHIIEVYYQNDNLEITSAWAIRRDTNTSTDNSIFMDGQVAAWNNYDNTYYNRIMIDSTSQANNATYIPTTAWKYLRITAHGTNLTSERFTDSDFTVLLSDISYIDTDGLTTGFMGFGQWAGGKAVKVDWVRVRKHLLIMPTYTFGAEESSNTAPTLDAKELYPASPYTDDALTLNATCSDADGGDTLTAVWTIYKDDVNQTALHGSMVVTNGTETLIYTIASGNTTKDEVWIGEVYCNDATVSSSSANTTSRTILNSLPVIGNPTLNDSTPETDDTLLCTNGTVTDADGDSITWYYRWYNTGVLIAGQILSTLGLDIAGLDKGDTIKCSTIASDGTANATAWTNSTEATIQNTTPTTTTPTLNPSANIYKTTTPITCNNASVSDADDDTITWYYQWYVDDVKNVTTQTITNTSYSRDDIVLCEIIASDDTANSTAYNSSSVTILNTAPTTPDITPTTNLNISVDYQELTCENSTDVDTDTIYYTIYGDTSATPGTVLQNTTGTTYNWTGLSEGYNYFRCAATDVTEYSSNTTVYHVYVDTITPASITYVSPTETDNDNVSQDYFYANVTFTETNPDTCLLDNGTNQTMTMVGTSYCYLNMTGQADGIQTYLVYVNDSMGHINSSDARTLTLDTTNPLIQFESPTYVNNSNISINYTVVNTTFTELNIESVIFDWNGTNYTMLDGSLVLYMNLDNNSALGETSVLAVDNTEYGNNGTIVDGVWNASGNLGGAMDFNGASAYIDCGNSSSTDITANLTVSAWIRPDDITTYQMVVSKMAGTYSYRMYVIGTQLNFGIYKPMAGWYTASSTVASTDAWYHVVGVYDGTEVLVYVDAVNGTESPYTGAVNSVPAKVCIGAMNPDSPSTFFNGTIDEVKIWDRALSADEVLVEYGTYLKKINDTDWYLQVNMTDQSDGSYDYNSWVNDTSGNSNQTDIRTLTVDTVNPTMNITDPKNDTTQETSTNLYVTVTEQVETLVYSVDGGANVTLCTDCTTYSASNLFTVVEGTHNLTVYGTDYANLSGSDTVYWTVLMEGGGGSGAAPAPSITPIIDNITEEVKAVIIEAVDYVVPDTLMDRIYAFLDLVVYDDTDTCYSWEAVDEGDLVCKEWRQFSMLNFVQLFFIVLFGYILYTLCISLIHYKDEKRFEALSEKFGL